MALTEMADDFDRLMEPAGEIASALNAITDDPQDAIFVLSMVAAFMINTGRQPGVPLKTALDAYCSMVRELAELGEDMSGESKGTH